MLNGVLLKDGLNTEENSKFILFTLKTNCYLGLITMITFGFQNLPEAALVLNTSLVILGFIYSVTNNHFKSKLKNVFVSIHFGILVGVHIGVIGFYIMNQY